MSTKSVLNKVNAIPALTFVASTSVGLGSGIYWLAGLALAILFSLVRAPRNLFRALLRTAPATVVILLFSVYTLFATRDIQATASVLNLACLAPMIILFVAQYQRFGVSYFIQGLRALNYVLLATACWGIIEGVFKFNVLVYIYPHILGSWRMGTPSYRASSIFSHPIPFAHMLLIGLIITWTLRHRPLLKIVISLVYVSAIVMTQTRSVWGILALLLLLAAVFHGIWLRRGRAVFHAARRAWPFVIGGAGLLALFVWLTPFGQGAIDRLMRVSLEDVSLTQRTASINVVLDAVFNQSSMIELLFGHGFASSNAFILSQTLVLEGISTTDNQFLSILFDFGVVGALLFLAVSVYVIVAWWRLSRRLDADKLQLVLCAGYIAAGSFIFMTFYSFTIWRGTQVAVVAVFCVLILLQRENTRLRPRAVSEVPTETKTQRRS